MDYKQKYLKYKTKYLNQLKRGGATSLYDLNGVNDVTNSDNYKVLKKDLEQILNKNIVDEEFSLLNDLQIYFFDTQEHKSDSRKIYANEYYYNNSIDIIKVEDNSALKAFQKDILSLKELLKSFINNLNSKNSENKELIKRLSPLFTINGVNKLEELFYQDLSDDAFAELDRKSIELKAREAELNKQEKERANSNTANNSVITEVPFKIVPSNITTCKQYLINCKNPMLVKGTFKDFCTNKKYNCDTEKDAKNKIALIKPT